jgi:hypothetical protein
MNNNQFSGDIVPPARKRSIRDIPVPNRNKNTDSMSYNDGIQKMNPAEGSHDIVLNKNYESDSYEQTETHTYEQTENTRNHTDNNSEYYEQINDTEEIEYPIKVHKNKGFKKRYIFGGLVLVLAALFFIISLFDSATLEITPKSEVVNINKTLTIEDSASKINPNSLSYRKIDLAKESSVIVQATDEELVQEKASGKITIFNEYSTKSQKLIKNTRFESSDGRIYRILESVSVPGFTESGDTITPGQIDVTVYADEIGESFNLNSDEFTIPGFKGQEPYDFFYAKTKTAITGGFDGVRKIVTEDSIKSAEINLKKELEKQLLDEINNQTTEEFYVLQNSNSYSFDPIKQVDSATDNSVTLSMKGYISAFIFNKVDLSNKIGDGSLSKVSSNEDVIIENLDDISISLNTNELEEEIIVSGNTSFVWVINTEKLKEDMAGVEKKKLSTIMAEYPGIQEAVAVVKPVWRNTFPSEISNIEIKIIN